MNIDGYDIKKMGIDEGPLIGEILDYLHDLILDNPKLNKEEILIKKAKNYIERRNK